jgi:thiamine-phosphate pyrophosphorylase
MAQCKQLRHDVVQVLARLPQADLSAARDVQQDVGRTVKTEAEFERADLAAVLAANWQRVQQALRGLEEFTKVIAPDTARQLETLRYRAYVLDRAVSIQHDSVVRLADARLYVLVDGRSSSAEFRELVAQLIEGGVDVLQLRDKTLPDRSLLERARILRTLTRGQRVLFIMNDRVDLALMADADGVHVGQDEVTVQDARRLLGSRALIGVSTHNLEQARQAVLDGANYLGCGPTFPSSTKPFERYPGLDLVAQISVDIRLPAFAIGGIDLQNVGAVCAAGLRRVAVSHSVIGAADPRRAAQQLKGVLCAAEGAGR